MASTAAVLTSLSAAFPAAAILRAASAVGTLGGADLAKVGGEGRRILLHGLGAALPKQAEPQPGTVSSTLDLDCEFAAAAVDIGVPSCPGGRDSHEGTSN